MQLGWRCHSPATDCAVGAESCGGSFAAQLRHRCPRVPHFLFNDRHLWAVKGTAERGGLDFFLSGEWTRLNPKFVGEVHLSIIQEAIGGVQGIPSWVITDRKDNFSKLFLAGLLSLMLLTLIFPITARLITSTTATYRNRGPKLRRTSRLSNRTAAPTCRRSHARPMLLLTFMPTLLMSISPSS